VSPAGSLVEECAPSLTPILPSTSARRPPYEIDEIERIGRLRVAAPGNMLVRAHQHEFVAIKLRCLTRSHVENGKRKATLRSRRHDAGDMRRGVEAQ
jgi:hypothetical protein